MTDAIFVHCNAVQTKLAHLLSVIDSVAQKPPVVGCADKPRVDEDILRHIGPVVDSVSIGLSMMLTGLQLILQPIWHPDFENS